MVERIERTGRLESVLVLAISIAALGLTAAAVLTSPPEDARQPAAAATARPEAPRSAAAPGSLARQLPAAGAPVAGKRPAPPANSSPPRVPAAVPSGQRCALRRWQAPACEAPAAASRRLPG